MAGLAAVGLLLPFLASIGSTDPVQASNPTCSVTTVTSGSVTTYTFTNTTACQWTAPDPTGKTVTVTVVGGGGGGGGGFDDVTSPSLTRGGGGGGGGQVTEQSLTDLTAGTSVTVTVGAGGNAGSGVTTWSTAVNGSDGASSTFAYGSTTVTAVGGGGGVGGQARGTLPAGGDGGASGNQFAGGAGSSVLSNRYGGGGGGGGSTAAGGAAPANNYDGGNGGNGSTIGGSQYAGGGGGGARAMSEREGAGAFGGGRGGGDDPVEAGTANTGGGGGGGVGIDNSNLASPFPGNGGAGGSGVVIVTYAAPVPPTLVNKTPPTTGTVNTPYAGYTFTASGTTPITFTEVTSGSLPPGLTLASNGVLSGTPTTAGPYTFKVRASNGTSPDGETSNITITISPAPAAPVFTDDTPPTSGAVGTAYAGYTFTASGSPAPTFSLVAPGSLPPGLTLGSNGVLSGTPTTVGTYTFKVKATNTQGNAETSDITITVTAAPNPPVPVSPPEMSPATQSLAGVTGTPVTPTSRFTLTNFTMNVRYSIYPLLPAGLALDPVTGVVSGTPTRAYPVTKHWITAIGGGGSESAYSVLNVSVAASPTPPGPVPVPPLEPGGSHLTVDGVPQQVKVDPNKQSDGIDITGDDFSMNLQGLDGQGQPLRLAPDGVLILNQDRQVQTTGTGFMATSEVDLYLDPPTLVTRSARSDAGIYLGTVITNSSGSFVGTATLPPGIAVGDHVVQAVGLSKAGAVRAMSLGVRVEPEVSLVLDQGMRTADGRHDRIRTTGTSTGIPAGTKLTPYIKYSGQASFTQGKATIVVQSDGTFKWTRQIRKDKAVTGYVTWTDIESNKVTWVKVR